MLMMARSILDINKIDTMDVIFEQIDEVTSTKLQELANEIFDIDKFSFLKYIPK
jgi:predicted Zn-dependent peptidase